MSHSLQLETMSYYVCILTGTSWHPSPHSLLIATLPLNSIQLPSSFTYARSIQNH